MKYTHTVFTFNKKNCSKNIYCICICIIQRKLIPLANKSSINIFSNN